MVDLRIRINRALVLVLALVLGAGLGTHAAAAAESGPMVDDGYEDPNRTRFIEVPSPRVPSRVDVLGFYPCTQCHDYRETDLTERLLVPVHYNEINHGRGTFWCHTCHDPDEINSLQVLNGHNVSFDEAWKVCGQCHQAHEEDWHYGAHGKRTRSWQGEPIRYNCTHCHNPHDPAFMRRKPSPPSPVRAGLEPMPERHAHENWWLDSIDFHKTEVKR